MSPRLDRRLLGGLPDLKFSLSSEGTILEYLSGADDLLYAPPEAFLGRSMHEVLPTSVSMLFEDRLSRLAETGELQAFEYRLPLPQGTLDFEARLFRLDDEQVLLFARDITQRRSAERQLERFRTILDATPDFVGSATPDGRVLYANPNGRAMVGIAEDEDVSSFTIQDFHTEGGYRRLVDEVIPAAIERGSWTGEIEFRHRDGTTIPALMVLLAHRADDGSVDFLSTISRDLRATRRAEERERKLVATRAAAAAEREKSAQLERALLQLERAHEELKATQDQLRQSSTLAAVGQLAGGIAHDFNNLLSVILGFVTLSMDRIGPEHEAHDDLVQVRQAADRASQLTQQLLAFSRKRPVRPEVLQLEEVVADMSRLLGRALGEDIRLETRAQCGLWRVRVDRSQIEQVILNLALNARDAMPRGGQLAIEIQNVDLSAPNRVLGLRAGRYVQLSVKDDGTGMSPEVQERAFEPFFTTKEVGKGTGMGLAMVFGVIKQAEGEVFVESELGRGTTIRIYLPETTSVPARERPQREDPRPQIGRLESVLLVEDEATVREVARRILTKGGYQVIAAGSGEEALALLAKGPPVDLLLTDVVMPGTSGVELARQALLSHPGLRVLYMSGYPERGTEHHQPLARDVYYVAKPFTEAELLRAVSWALSEPNSSLELS